MITRSGHCLCGAVRFDVRDVGPHYGICHCKMCQRWTGGAFFGLTVPAARMTIRGGEHIAFYQSSASWKRCWCGTCGSSLWGHVNSDAADGGVCEVQIGLLDDTSGLILHRELFVDMRPESYALTGNHQRESAADARVRLGVQP